MKVNYIPLWNPFLFHLCPIQLDKAKLCIVLVRAGAGSLVKGTGKVLDKIALGGCPDSSLEYPSTLDKASSHKKEKPNWLNINMYALFSIFSFYLLHHLSFSL